VTRVADRLLAAGLVLPCAPQALGSYVPAVRAGDLVFTAGQLPLRDGSLVASGPLDPDDALEVAADAARQSALNALAAASTVCDLDDVVRVVKLTGYVASAAGFTAQPAVLDGASAVLLAAFGETGRHARAAVGVTGLPLNATVEVELVLQVG
jgi:enamine deaminase RidA (YjgF/YER057c/UK114 family)